MAPHRVSSHFANQVALRGETICVGPFGSFQLKVNPGPNAAMLNVIMTKAKRYSPIANPMPICIARTTINQRNLIFLDQIKKEYPVSRGTQKRSVPERYSCLRLTIP